jgi:hypothetical protein
MKTSIKNSMHIKEALYVWALFALVTALSGCGSQGEQEASLGDAAPGIVDVGGSLDTPVTEDVANDRDNPAQDQDQAVAQDDQAKGPTKSTHTVYAAKAYGPTRWKNGYLELAQTHTIRIPATLEVVEGNAGNHKAWVNFGKMRCVYRGGASQAHPSSDSQINKGLKYHFQACLDEQGDSLKLLAGEEISFSGMIEVSVDNGSHRSGTTSVKAVFEVVKN